LKDRSNAKISKASSKIKVGEKGKHFILKEGIMYKVGQDNKMHRCLTTLEAQIVLKELHLGVVEDILLQILM
jgi:hypothetical protein